MPVGSLPSSTSDGGVASAYCVVLQSPAAAPQVAAKVQGGLLVFLIVILPPPEVMMAVSPGWVSWMHSKRVRADRGGAVLQSDDGLAALRQDIERGAAHADGRQRCRDLVGRLFRMAGDEAERARGQPDRDVAIVMLVVEHGAVELERRAGPSERLVLSAITSRVALSMPVRTVSSRSSLSPTLIWLVEVGNAEHFVLDDGGFADAGLRVRGTRHAVPGQLQIGKESSYANSFHSRSTYPDIVPDRARV